MRAPAIVPASEIRSTLARAKTVAQAKDVRDKAKALAAYFRTQRQERGRALDYEDAALDAEIRCGELLQPHQEKRGGSNSRRRSLPEGLSWNQSTQWQKLAIIASEQPKELAAYRKEQRETEGAITRAGALKIGKAREKQETLDGIAEEAKNAQPLNGIQPHPVIYADPPWQYGNTAGASAAESHYPTMPLSDICALQVPATDDAILFLWATSPLLPEALQVVEAWGFTYKGSMVWDKGSGTGNWVLNAHEFLLFGVRGDLPCPLPASRPVSVIREKVGRHSQKPAAFAQAIDRMYPTLPKLEMFARESRGGLWTVWGNET